MADSFSPPEQVRKNSKRSLELRKKYNRGMTAVGVARARDLSNGKNISVDTIKRMHSYFARHEIDKKGKDWANQSNPSAGYIAWLGWGGDAGRSWVNGIIKKLETKESQETLNMASIKAATIRGIFLKPGLSKNRRLYTRGNIAKAVERMKQQLLSGNGMPLNMATSHGAAFTDDALSTVGNVKDVWLNPDGSASFEADIANTAHGRDVANLAAGKFIKGVSIRGEWRGEPRSITHTDGQEAVTADDLAIHGIDFTNSPGVEGAEIQSAVLAESHNALSIFESVENVEIISRDEELVATQAADIIRDAVENAVEDAVSAIFEKDTSKPYGDVTYADPGYQKDKKKRYPINTSAHVRAAWSYINQADNAELYTAAQLARVKSRIKSAAKKFGINIVSEHATIAADIQDILEAYASIALVNDDDSISITGYATDPHQLKMVANRIAFGAIAAMHAIDPDDDGDIYLSKPDWSHVDDTGDASVMGPEDEDMKISTDDNNMECHECGMPAVEDAHFCHNCGAAMAVTPSSSAPECANCGESVPQDAMYCPTCGGTVPQAESSDTALTQEMEEVTVTDNQNTAETPAEETALETTAARTLSDADLKALANMLIAAKATESEPEADDAEVAPEEEAVEAPAEEVAAEEVAAEESNNNKETLVSENTFTAEQVAVMIAEAAQTAATAAVAEAQKNAVESYRSGKTTFRKGLVGSSTGNDASDLSESEELDPRMLAEMNSTAFRKVQNEAWSGTPFFANKFAQADRGF
jgi:RNA polymerase subunit RPABC4/transcription elongation factor Spt4